MAPVLEACPPKPVGPVVPPEPKYGNTRRDTTQLLAVDFLSLTNTQLIPSLLYDKLLPDTVGKKFGPDPKGETLPIVIQ